jgi:putative redox protein
MAVKSTSERMTETVKQELREVRSSTAGGAFGQQIEIGTHRLTGDEPLEKGGDDNGPAPHELLLAAIASCASMTVKAYAARKGLSLRAVDVHVRGRHESGAFVVEREVRLDGDLDEAQRARLVEIAGRCPVSKTLAAEIRIVSV